MKRFLIISVITLVLVIIAVGLGGRSYLRSPRVTQQVAARLETLYGGPVRVENVDIGFGSTSINGLSFYEEGRDGDADALWLKVGSLTADVSLWDLIAGDAMPKQVTLQGATLVLRSDKEGTLLTRLVEPASFGESESAVPKAFPEGTLKQGEIIFRKDGQPDLVAKNVNAQVANKDGGLVLSGTAENAELGKLIITGTLDKEVQNAKLHLQLANKAHVTQTVLDRIPFVPRPVWREVRFPEGDTSAELTVRFDLKSKVVNYRVDLAPENAKVLIASIGLSADGARGKVTVEDNVVHLRAVEGETYGGSFRTDADLDFRGPTAKLVFTMIQVKEVNVNELPENWNIPNVARKTVTKGKLTGVARLELNITPRGFTAGDACELMLMQGGAFAAGSGQWFAPVSRFAVTLGNDVRAFGKGKGRVVEPAGGNEAIEFTWRLGPVSTPTSRRSAPGDLYMAALLLNAMIIEMQKEVQPEKAGKTAPNYLDVNLNLKDASLTEMIKNLDVKIPFEIAGKASLQVKASLPTDRPEGVKARGSMQLRELVVAGMDLGDLDAELVYANGVLELTSLTSSLAIEGDGTTPGTIRGAGRFEFDPPGEVRAELLVDRVPFAKLTPLEKGRLGGTFSGKINLRAPAKKVGTLTEYKADGQIASDWVVLDGWKLEKVSSSIKLEKGVVQLADLQFRSEGSPTSASAKLDLNDSTFAADLDLQKWNLSAMQKLVHTDKNSAFTLSGAFTTTAKVKGKLEPFTIKASGEARAEGLKVEAFEAQDVQFRWATDGKTLDLKDLNAVLYGGKATGTGVVPIDSTLPGKMDLEMHGVETAKLAKDLRVPFKIDGRVSGMLHGTLPPVKDGASRSATLKLDLRAPKLRVQEIPTEELQGTLGYKDGVVDYKFEGKSLGGTFDLEGQIPSPMEPANEKAKKGRLSLRDVRMRRLFRALDVPNAESVVGRLNLVINYTHKDGQPIPNGRGTLQLTGVRWKDRILADNLQGDVVLSEQAIRIRNFEGTLADGTFNGQFYYSFQNPSRSWFTFSLDSLETAILFAPWLEDNIEGSVQMRIRGDLGEGWRGSAELEMARGKVFGIGISQWRLPATWSFSPGQNRGQIDIHETTAQMARGRATGKMSVAWDSNASARIEGNLRFANADLQDFLRQTIGPSGLGSGQMAGQVSFTGKEVRSINDLSAKISVAFNQAQALQLPVLRQIAPYLGIGASTTFQKGELLARLDRGVVRIDQMNLQGNALLLHLDGTSTLDGRLNLDVIAKVSALGAPTAPMRLVGQRIPPTGAVPAGVLQEANSLLSKQVLHLQVSGTFRSPVIRTRPLANLTESAVRFFFNRSSGPTP